MLACKILLAIKFFLSHSASIKSVFESAETASFGKSDYGILLLLNDGETLLKSML